MASGKSRVIHEFEMAAEAVIKKYEMIKPGERVLAGVSGGADSRCLLETLLVLGEKNGFDVSVVHVDHGIRATSGRDARAVRALCEKRGVPVRVFCIEDIKKQAPRGASPEEAARLLRYGFFAECMEELGADSLALAHNRDDQAETVLFRLFRGAGLKGIAGMSPVTKLKAADGGSEMRVIRPLLFTPRSDIEAYLAARGIDDLCIDETNETDDYARNRLRHKIIPEAARSVNAGAAAHTADAAVRVKEALDFIEEEAKKRYKEVKCGDSELNAELLCKEPEIMRREIIKLSLRDAGISSDIGSAHIEALLEMVNSREGTRAVRLPRGHIAVRRYDRIGFEREAKADNAEDIIVKAPAAGESTEVLLSGLGRVVLRVFERPEGPISEKIPKEPFTKWFDFDKMEELVCFRKRRAGDVIDVGAAVKKLSREMIDLKIPADERGRLWLMAKGSEILWIVGGRRSESFLVDDGTKFILEAGLWLNG